MTFLDPDALVPFLIFSIPIIAITGGIIAGIVKTLGRQRLAELAQRERIAAIERGIDPAKLPAAPGLDDGFDMLGRPYNSRYRHQSLIIGGLIVTFAGIGIMVFLEMLRPDDNGRIWAVGLIPTLVGLALLISAWIVKPRNGDSTGGPKV
jgi:hypothetical protein